MSITEITGYNTVEKIYVQLLYQCNFSCKHCFHGRQLESPRQLSLDDIQGILTHFRSEYGTRHVTLLGGEPFLHPDFATIAKWCAAHEWFVEICTNGHRFVHRQLPSVAHSIHFLRVSIDGLQPAHDAMRMRGSFAHAIETLRIARTLEITTGVTSTVTADNAQDLPGLAQFVSLYGVRELKLHQLRLVGNARTSQLSTASKEQLFKKKFLICTDHPVI